MIEETEVKIETEKAHGLIKYYIALNRSQDYDETKKGWVDAWHHSSWGLLKTSKDDIEKELSETYKTADQLKNVMIISFYLPAP